MAERKKLRGSTATYYEGKKTPECDLVELATAYEHMGNIPERVGWNKAAEICLLAQAFSASETCPASVCRKGEVMTFGKLRLSVKGTNNGRGFDILYDFGESYNFAEFESKKEFLFIQPWIQFPDQRYTDACMLTSIEVVRRFNEFEVLEARVKQMEEDTVRLYERVKAAESGKIGDGK